MPAASELWTDPVAILLCMWALVVVIVQPWVGSVAEVWIVVIIGLGL